MTDAKHDSKPLAGGGDLPADNESERESTITALGAVASKSSDLGGTYSHRDSEETLIKDILKLYKERVDGELSIEEFTEKLRRFIENTPEAGLALIEEAEEARIKSDSLDSEVAAAKLRERSLAVGIVSRYQNKTQTPADEVTATSVK
jgi:hypothetical protein